MVAVGQAPSSALADQLLRREGRFIRLTTDVNSVAEAETLVESFDAAVPQWVDFWGIPEDDLANWKVDAFVMRDKSEFDRQGLIPRRVPDFPFGYALGNRVWVLAQQSEYYTRHLLLHEGVHSLAFFHFGGAGPTWFREGTAELLATHHAAGAEIEINKIPDDRDDVPYWGRFKLMQQLRTSSDIPTLDTVMRYRPDLKGDVESYGWSWAAVMIFDAYPEYRDELLAAARLGRDDGPGFNQQLRQRLQNQWPGLSARWKLMCNDLDYGFDWSRERVELSPRNPRWNGKPIELAIAPDRGWQSTGVRIPGGVKVRLIPSGQVTLADDPKPWRSEPPGITFRYYRGRPIGQLLACVLPNAAGTASTSLHPLRVIPVVKETVIDVPKYSWLVLRVNDAVSELGDNKGEYRLQVTVVR